MYLGLPRLSSTATVKPSAAIEKFVNVQLLVMGTLQLLAKSFTRRLPDVKLTTVEYLNSPSRIENHVLVQIFNNVALKVESLDSSRWIW